MSLASAAARTGKTVLEVAKVILDIINAVRNAAWSRDELQGDLDRIEDSIKLVQSMLHPHSLPSTPAGKEALKQLQKTLEGVAKELISLRGSADAGAANAGQGRGLYVPVAL